MLSAAEIEVGLDQSICVRVCYKRLPRIQGQEVQSSIVSNQLIITQGAKGEIVTSRTYTSTHNWENELIAWLCNVDEDMDLNWPKQGEHKISIPTVDDGMLNLIIAHASGTKAETVLSRNTSDMTMKITISLANS